ncbi:hypothetical protein ALC60_03059 [Trachymyrmex zeteki]|uniref:Uncharacterized protein n=1 Tax=Mycetomoellerius zeteki TaxID=64791 RepID=A0A151XCJ0_9HYME|nr:hypothetical protein ALC60_03059 [Trachymyrmex zeteki]
MVSFSARIDKGPAATSTSGNNAELPSRMVETAGDNVTWDLEARETIAYSGNKPREQGNIGRLAPSTRWATRAKAPYWASRPHKPLSNRCLSAISSTPLLTGSVPMTMYHKTPTTMII